MKLAYGTNAYMRRSAPQAVAHIAAIGYEGIELMADEPHAWPARVTERELDNIRRALDDHGLAISNVNAFMMNAIADPRHPYWHPSWIEPDEEYRRVRVRHTLDAISMAARLGAPSVSTEPGGPLEGTLTRERAMDIFTTGLAEALRRADNEGVLLLVEPEPGLLIENVDQCLELCRRVDSPALGVNFDIGHFYCVRESLPEAVGRLAPFTRHYHVEDIAATRVHEHLVPGRGAIDFASVFDAIRATAYDGWITVELYPYIDDPDEAGAAARERLMPLLGP